MKTTKAQALAEAARPYLGDSAEELANNLACWDTEDLGVPTVAAAIQHRMVHFGVRCGDVELCATDIVRAAGRFTGAA